MRRIMTTQDFENLRRERPNPHFYKFSPINDEEKTSVADFEKDGWKVSLYLFGQRANPKIIKGKEQNEFSINYHLNNVLQVTSNLPSKQLPQPTQLLKQIETAFLEFQTPNSLNENEYEFSSGEWSYIAKPVRVANESCLKCHTDYVVQGKSGDKNYTFRKRQVGDTNGVIVYGFAKK